jgi:hypothetical protein
MTRRQLVDRAGRTWLASLLIAAGSCAPADRVVDGTDGPAMIDGAAVDGKDAPVDAPIDTPVPQPDAAREAPEAGGDDACPVASNSDAAVCNLLPLQLVCPATPGLTGRPGTTVGQPSLRDTYPCASGEGGGEIAYHFRSDALVEVEVQLKPRNRYCGSNPEGGPNCMSSVFPWAEGSRDLDLIVLEGASPDSPDAVCVGEGRALRRGFEEETLTFSAHGGRDYWVVVDSPPGQEGAFDLNIGCRSCRVSRGTLACNSTMVVAPAPGTYSGTSAYRCFRVPGGFNETFAEQTGFEDTYDLRGTADTNYTLRLSGLTSDRNLFVVNDWGPQCGEQSCAIGSASPGTADEVLHFSGGGGHVKVVVDGPEGIAAPYQLEVGCTPACFSSLLVSCNSPSGSRNDHPASRSQIATWGSCASGLTGPEVTYGISAPPRPGRVELVLSGLTADLDLIVLKGTESFTCDPTSACVASSTNRGTADERLTFDHDGISNYYINVDGRDGAVSAFQLSLSGDLCQ